MPFYCYAREIITYPQKGLHKNFYSSFIRNSPNWKLLKCPSTGERVHKYVYIMEYDPAIKMNKSFMHAVTCWAKESDTKRLCTVCFYLYEVQEQTKLPFEKRTVVTFQGIEVVGSHWKRTEGNFLEWWRWSMSCLGKWLHRCIHF